MNIMLRLLALLFCFNASAAELDTYYLVPFTPGTYTPAPSGYVPCDAGVYLGYWRNNEATDIWVTKYIVRLSTNMVGGTRFAEAVLWIETAHENYYIGSVQSDGGAVNHVLDYSPDSFRVPSGARIWIRTQCQYNNATVGPIPNWLPYPTVQSVVYAIFRRTP